MVKLQGQDYAVDGSQDSSYAEDNVVELGQQLQWRYIDSRLCRRKAHAQAYS